MAAWLFLKIQCNQSNIEKRITIRKTATVQQLLWYIKVKHGLDGTLYFNQDNISLQKYRALCNLGVTIGDVLELKNYTVRTLNRKKYKICLLPSGRNVDIELPPSITVEQFQFFIECEELIMIENQKMKQSGLTWWWASNPYHACTDDELRDLEICDISKQVDSLSKFEDEITEHSDNDCKTFHETNEINFSTESEGSSTDLDNSRVHARPESSPEASTVLGELVCSDPTASADEPSAIRTTTTATPTAVGPAAQNKAKLLPSAEEPSAINGATPTAQGPCKAKVLTSAGVSSAITGACVSIVTPTAKGPVAQCKAQLLTRRNVGPKLPHDTSKFESANLTQKHNLSRIEVEAQQATQTSRLPSLALSTESTRSNGHKALEFHSIEASSGLLPPIKSSAPTGLTTTARRASTLPQLINSSSYLPNTSAAQKPDPSRSRTEIQNTTCPPLLSSHRENAKKSIHGALGSHTIKASSRWFPQIKPGIPACLPMNAKLVTYRRTLRPFPLPDGGVLDAGHQKKSLPLLQSSFHVESQVSDTEQQRTATMQQQ